MAKAGVNKKPNGQLLWGIILILVGIAVFIRISQVSPQLAEMGQLWWFSRFGLYLMGVILVGGGIKKVLAYFQAPVDKQGESTDLNGEE